MVEQIERPTDSKERPAARPPASRRKRRTLMIILGVTIGFVVYGFAFEKTQVDLGEIQSETRQQSLTRILRALARPELVEYDTEQQFTDVPVAVPCGPALDTQAPGAEGPAITVDPTCAAPGETMTVSGTGFSPLEAVQVNFVPDSEFSITLPLARLQTDDAGSFTTTFEVPDRTSDAPQALQVVTSVRIGSWGSRQEVWTDSNTNEIREVPVIGADGTYRTVSSTAIPEIPGAALLDSSFTLVSFVTFGEPFQAVNGPANGQSSDPLGDVSDVAHVSGLTSGPEGTEVTVSGPAGEDITLWRVAIYDAATGAVAGTSPLADVIDLSPRISQTTLETWDKIVETVMLAFVATTAGLLLAVPLSFFAARNIMRDISSTVTNLALTLLAVPFGLWLGVAVSGGVQSITSPLRDNLALTLVGLIVVPIVIFAILRVAVPPEDEEPVTVTTRAGRTAGLIGAGLVALVGLQFLSEVLDRAGRSIQPVLGPFGFLGGFLQQLSELNDVLTPILTALAGAAVLVTLAGRLGYVLRSHLPAATLTPLNLTLAALAGAIWFLLVAQGIDWFYRFDNPALTLWGPAVVGAVFGVFLAARNIRTGEVKVGLTVYYLSRTVFNSLRSIEPLVMVIVFVVWVGFGAFAGSLALALHTAAALAKLYSEQVESISTGPIEAIRATGATRLQTVVYGVVPQIIPPYISFTMYRWDINVRMSTILGFAGGGGIGFLLAQNVNLLQYRAAAVQMLAIAIVVASMDYLSARLRERLV